MLSLRFFLGVLVLAAATASAVVTEIQPAAPTSAAPVSVTISSDLGLICAPTRESVTRNGSSIRLELSYKSLICPAAIGTWQATYELDTYPAGEYDLEVFVDTKRYATTKFVVRHANPPFTVRPFAHVSRPAGPQIDAGVEAVIEGLPALCRSEVCPNVKVFFGDVAVQANNRAGRLTARVPAHAPGVFDVKVVDEDSKQTFVSPGAVYFYGRDAAPDSTVWSRVLFPVLQSGSGAFGAQWITDVVIFNGNDYVVENYNRVDPLQCFDVGCERLAARQYFKFEGRNHPRGAALLVPRDSVDAFSFSSRVRDRSREAEDFGTEVPVIRESDMRRTGFRLLDIPATSAYRSKLRVYVYASDEGRSVGVQGSFPDREGVFFRQFPLERVDASLAFAEIDLQTLSEIQGDSVILEIVPPSGLPTWAFVTVTNNATQRVTVVTPN